jgi:anthraniloyl-CoA monooxygenase
MALAASAVSACSTSCRRVARNSASGWFQAHAYQYDHDTSTFIVEAPEEVWQKAGLGMMKPEQAIAFCEKLFGKYLDGYGLMSNAAHLRGSAMWITFPRIVCAEWVHSFTTWGRRMPVVMGDAAHTAQIQEIPNANG